MITYENVKSEIQEEFRKDQTINNLENNLGIVNNPINQIKANKLRLLKEKIVDKYRHNIIEKIEEKTGRYTIFYFSGYLINPQIQTIDFSINENDIMGLQNIISSINIKENKFKGLNLILHTPGGDVSSAEKIIKYIWKEFGKDIKVIVPHTAMSAGTMIACAAKEIIMFNNSSLGPCDPHWYGYPCYSILEEFELAKDEIAKNQITSLAWREILAKYNKTEIIQCKKAIKLSNEITSNNLKNMLGSDDEKIQKICNELCSNKNSKIHTRSFDYDYCNDLGLIVSNLDIKDEYNLKDDIMRLYWAIVYFNNYLPISKLIESSSNTSFKLYINANNF